MTLVQKVLLGIATAVSTESCDTDSFHDLNNNAQAVHEINMNFLFSAAELSTASGGASGSNSATDLWTNINYCAGWMQHLATLSVERTGEKYMVDGMADSAPWDVIYGDPLKNLAEVLKQTGAGGFEEGRRANTRQASRILRAFLFQKLTDSYGNIPYSEALNQQIFFPKYDHQSTIYLDLLHELDEAAAAISNLNTDDGFESADRIYNGNIAKWKKWSYSLMLRMAMRISKVEPSVADTYVTKAVEGGVFENNSDNVWVPMATGPSQWVNHYGISFAFSRGSNRILSKTLIDKLKRDSSTVSDDDPRLMFISGGVAGNTDPLVQKGMPNGVDVGWFLKNFQAPNAVPQQQFATVNTKLLDPEEPYLLMHYAEVEFLLAEAIERHIGKVAGTAKEHFEAGVAAAIDVFSVYDASFKPNDGVVARYISDLNYLDGAPNALEMLGDQMWISKWFNWWDAWSDWRRMGYPVLVPVNYPGNSTGGTIPRKLFLPMQEQASNAANVAEGATFPGGPYENMARVWWDVN